MSSKRGLGDERVVLAGFKRVVGEKTQQRLSCAEGALTDGLDRHCGERWFEIAIAAPGAAIVFYYCLVALPVTLLPFIVA